jgi:hypothetical protein
VTWHNMSGYNIIRGLNPVSPYHCPRSQIGASGNNEIIPIWESRARRIKPTHATTTPLQPPSLSTQRETKAKT